MMTKDLSWRLSQLTASAVADVQAGAGTLGRGLVRVSGARTVAGRAVTARCAEGSVRAMLAASEHASAGDVLVVEAPGDSAYVGDLAAADFARRGITAVVIDANVRDRAVLARSAVSFFARGFTPAALRRQDPGEAMIPVTLGPTQVSPGDWIVADDDGAVAIKASDVDDVVLRAEAHLAFEARVMSGILGGMSLLEAFSTAD